MKKLTICYLALFPLISCDGDYSLPGYIGGMYDGYVYNPLPDQRPVLYYPYYDHDLLKLFHLDIKSGLADLVSAEPASDPADFPVGTAFSFESGILIYSKIRSGEIWISLFPGILDSYYSGKLSGAPACATLFAGIYYYHDKKSNTINGVHFAENWMISGEEMLYTLPGNISVKDMAMSPAGDCLYLLAELHGDARELYTLNLDEYSLNAITIKLSETEKIAFGSDNLLYSLSHLNQGGTRIVAEVIDTD